MTCLPINVMGKHVKVMGLDKFSWACVCGRTYEMHMFISIKECVANI